MDLSTLETMSTLRNKEGDNTYGQMGISISENGMTTPSMEKVSTFGLMAESTAANGKII